MVRDMLGRNGNDLSWISLVQVAHLFTMTAVKHYLYPLILNHASHRMAAARLRASLKTDHPNLVNDNGHHNRVKILVSQNIFLLIPRSIDPNCHLDQTHETCPDRQLKAILTLSILPLAIKLSLQLKCNILRSMRYLSRQPLMLGPHYQLLCHNSQPSGNSRSLHTRLRTLLPLQVIPLLKVMHECLPRASATPGPASRFRVEKT